MKVLISGMGIAGPTCAYWLDRFGFEVTLIEVAPAFRDGGYMIDFWGAGFDIAEKMGLMPALLKQGYRAKELWLVDEAGRRNGGFPIDVMDDLTHGRYLSLRRGDLATEIYRTVQGNVESIFGDHISRIDEEPNGVRVTLASGQQRNFDLLIGADGLHSGVRALVFGPQERFEHYLGYAVAAFECQAYRPRDELIYVSYATPGQQTTRFAMRDDKTMILMVFASEQPLVSLSDEEKRRKLHACFAHTGWESDRILQAMDASHDLYFDRVSQIRMDQWVRGRVALIGDAASCPSLLAGQGSALAMIAAYILAGELASQPDYRVAFARYEQALKSFIDKKQKAAVQFASAFAPKTRVGIWMRALVTKMMRYGPIAKLSLGRSLSDSIVLPDYAKADRFRTN